jgi:flagellar biogenesis protein FliO
MIEYVIKVLFLLVAFLSSLFLLARYGSRLRIGDLKKEKGLRKIDTVHLGYKRFLSLVEYEDRVFLIGVGEREISLLSAWKKGEN